ncbi:MAG: feruloyl-CoA synthase [Thermodesulfobacteriota bacterium]
MNPFSENPDAGFAPPLVDLQYDLKGDLEISSPQELNPFPRHIIERLIFWSRRSPSRVFMAERDGGNSWRTITYARTFQKIRSIAQSLLNRKLSNETPVLILSENGIDHALIQLGCMYVGIPAAPVSPAYSLISRDFEKLKWISKLIEPRLVYASDGKRFQSALSIPELESAEVVISRNPPENGKSKFFSELLNTHDPEAADRIYHSLTLDSIAKILFTSGSTGTPKGVINTQRMLCSNQQSILQVWPFLSRRPPVVVDWLPWSHTFGGNQNFNLVLYNGGSLYIDEGKPVPHLMERTLRNLQDISQTLYFNVPRGFDALIPALAKSDSFRNHFFKDLDLIFYAGAALPQHLWERLQELSLEATGSKIPILSGWGATETAPMVTIGHFITKQTGVIGLPGPGCRVKLIPCQGKLELRVKGPNVTPGYWKNDTLTRTAFDEEGFYCTGDAGKWVDPGNPSRGILFDGRVAEDFKILTGTWVHVGALRIALISACEPVISDAVITGHDRNEIGAILFPDIPGCRSLCSQSAEPVTGYDWIRRPEIRKHLVWKIEEYNRSHPGSSTRISRILMTDLPPSIDANEITDKGYMNQRAVLSNRVSLVERLYSAHDDDPDVIFF